MKITDKATGTVYTISNWDGQPGDVNYMQHVIGNTGSVGITYNDDTDVYEADMDTIQWWLDYVKGMRDMTQLRDDTLDAIDELEIDDAKKAEMKASLRAAIADSACGDMADEPSHGIGAIEEWVEANMPE